MPSLSHTLFVSPLSEALGHCCYPCGLGSLPQIYAKVTKTAPYKSQGWWVGKHRTRAVASLETIMRVVASLEVSNSRECGVPIWARAMAPGEGGIDLD